MACCGLPGWRLVLDPALETASLGLLCHWPACLQVVGTLDPLVPDTDLTSAVRRGMEPLSHCAPWAGTAAAELPAAPPDLSSAQPRAPGAALVPQPQMSSSTDEAAVGQGLGAENRSCIDVFSISRHECTVRMWANAVKIEVYFGAK